MSDHEAGMAGLQTVLKMHHDELEGLVRDGTHARPVNLMAIHMLGATIAAAAQRIATAIDRAVDAP